MWYLKFHTEYFKKMAERCPNKCYERYVSLGIPYYEWRTRALIAAHIQWDKEKKDPTVHLPQLVWMEELADESSTNNHSSAEEKDEHELERDLIYPSNPKK